MLPYLCVVAGKAAACEQRTGVPCTSNEMCRALCIEKKAGYTGGRCSLEFVVADPSCVCSKPCGRQAVMPAPVKKKEEAAAAAAGRRGMEDARLI